MKLNSSAVRGASAIIVKLQLSVMHHLATSWHTTAATSGIRRLHVAAKRGRPSAAIAPSSAEVRGVGQAAGRRCQVGGIRTYSSVRTGHSSGNPILARQAHTRPSIAVWPTRVITGTPSRCCPGWWCGHCTESCPVPGLCGDNSADTDAGADRGQTQGRWGQCLPAPAPAAPAYVRPLRCQQPAGAKTGEESIGKWRGRAARSYVRVRTLAQNRATGGKIRH